MRTIRLDSKDDERLSAFRDVPDPELLSRLGLFVAEGRLVVARLLASRLETRALLVTEPALASLRDLIAHAAFPVYIVPQAVMNGVAGFNFHRGCLAIGVRPPARNWREVVEDAGLRAGSTNQDPAYGGQVTLDPAYCGQVTLDPACGRAAQDPDNGQTTHDCASGSAADRSAIRQRSNAPVLLALERVGNVDNVGAIFRNAAAFGARGVLLQADCADPLYRKAIRTSMAASLVTPYATVPWPDALQDLRGRGWATVAMTPAAEAPLLRDVSAALPGHSIVIVLGHEGDGLSSAAMEACTHRARIEVASHVDSVNVATAAAIALYELVSSRAG